MSDFSLRVRSGWARLSNAERFAGVPFAIGATTIGVASWAIQGEAGIELLLGLVAVGALTVEVLFAPFPREEGIEVTGAHTER